MSVITLNVDAILFDMDGTLIDSAAGVVRVWENLQRIYPTINVQKVLSSIHGARTIDSLKVHCGITDPQELDRIAEYMDNAIITCASENGSKGICPLPGVGRIMEELAVGRHLPDPCWAICTSSTRSYAVSALTMANVPLPDVFVTAEDVVKGKPFPDPYLLGAEKCGVKSRNCVVFEDTPSGVRSGRAAGCKTIGLLTTHTREMMEECQPDFIVEDLSKVTVRRADNGVEVSIHTHDNT